MQTTVVDNAKVRNAGHPRDDAVLIIAATPRLTRRRRRGPPPQAAWRYLIHFLAMWRETLAFGYGLNEFACGEGQGFHFGRLAFAMIGIIAPGGHRGPQLDSADRVPVATGGGELVNCAVGGQLNHVRTTQFSKARIWTGHGLKKRT